MIPTLILFGLVFGRWWRVSLLTAATGWPVLLVATGTMGVGAGLVPAAALAVVNTVAGVLVHQGVVRAARLVRRRATPSASGSGTVPP